MNVLNSATRSNADRERCRAKSSRCVPNQHHGYRLFRAGRGTAPPAYRAAPAAHFRPELVCIVDAYDRGILVYCDERRARVVPPLRLLHRAKRIFETRYMKRFKPGMKRTKTPYAFRIIRGSGSRRLADQLLHLSMDGHGTSNRFCRRRLCDPVRAYRASALAFLGQSASMAGVIPTAGFSMFPFVMPSSSHPASSLTLWDASSSHLTLTVMFWAAVIFVPIILAYTVWTYRAMWGKVTVEQIRTHYHESY